MKSYVEKRVICIICPRGCEIRVRLIDGKIIGVEGYSCPMGKKYAEQEVCSPKRVLMTIVKCENGDLPVVSVKTSGPVPKDKLLEISRYLAGIKVKPPIRIGDVIIRNVLDLGVDIVATRPCMPVENKYSDQK